MTDFHTLQKNLDQAMQADRHRLRRQLHELQKQTPQDEAKLAQWLERFQASVAKVEARQALGFASPALVGLYRRAQGGHAATTRTLTLA